MPCFHILSFGCRASQADGVALEQELVQRGFRPVRDQAEADIVLVNSCTVTAAADQEVRQTIQRIHQKNPAAYILVTGCYAQRAPQEMAALPGVRWVAGNSHKTKIGQLLSQEYSGASGARNFVSLPALFPPALRPLLDSDFHTPGFSLPTGEAPPSAANLPTASKICIDDVFAQRQFLTAPVLGGAAAERTRPNLKIQDGCNNRCSFCIIPYVRGHSRSLPLSAVRDHLRSLCEAGYREVVLSGINLGQYGRDLPGKLRLSQLLQAILQETPIERLRLSSVEPMDFTDALLDLMASSSRIAKHIHAPLQSGSERILRRMHRKYHPHNYHDRILAAYERMPNAAFGADVIVGFPGELEEDFEQTRSLIDSLPFTYLHVFPFSRRSGTPADTMPGQINGSLIRKRSRLLRELAAEKNLRFRQQQVGQILSVITLKEETPGGTSALSDHYLKVLIAGQRLPANQLVTVKISGLFEDRLLGTINPSVPSSP